MPVLSAVAPTTGGFEDLYTSLMNLSPTTRREIFDGLEPKTRTGLFTQYGAKLGLDSKPIPGVKQKSIEIETPLFLVNRIDGYLADKKYTDKMGPVFGRAYATNPWDPNVREFESNMAMTSQVIGKYLEGGKLTDQDIIRYRGMLPQMSDTPEVARRKTSLVRDLLKANQQAYVHGSTSTIGGGVELPDLPFNPNQVPLQMLNDWLLQNPEYEHGEELLEIYQAREALESSAAVPGE